jgi:hypothetical protein
MRIITDKKTLSQWQSDGFITRKTAVRFKKRDEKMADTEHTHNWIECRERINIDGWELRCKCGAIGHVEAFDLMRDGVSSFNAMVLQMRPELGRHIRIQDDQFDLEAAIKAAEEKV